MPQLIREYIAEMKLHLEYLTRQPELPLEEKLHFLRETRHCYGRTALVLSGGGALGVFHLVRVVCRTEVGEVRALSCLAASRTAF
jgi:TAG lipase / steryl ester hydrolase / phospholipase A2 / LPA acyltransferase